MSASTTAKAQAQPASGATSSFRSKKWGERLSRLGALVLVILFSLVILLPVAWMLSTALKTRNRSGAVSTDLDSGRSAVGKLP